MQKSQLIFLIIYRFQESRVSIYNKVFCLIVTTGRFFYPSHHFISPPLLPYPPRLQRQSEALCEQHRHLYSSAEFLALHSGRTFYLLPSSALHPSLPSSLHSSLSPLPWSFPDRPTANVHQMPPPPSPATHNSTPSRQPVTAHPSVRYRQMELLSVLVSLCLSQPLSPTLHTVYFVFLFLIPYQVKNK